jgi:protocatechuate 3,4-dioxygenase beta subunit
MTIQQGPMMTDRKGTTRREFAKRVGLGAGLSLLAARGVSANVVTPSQVEGPFHPIDGQDDLDADLTRVDGRPEPAIGKPVLVRGHVVDTDGKPVEGATLDIWQANYFGRYSHPKDKNDAPLDPNFQGWAMIHSREAGRYGLKTIIPGPYPLKYIGFEGWRCRHIHFKVSHPDFEDLTTQMYFEGDPWIAQDEEIRKAPVDQRDALIARASTDEATGMTVYVFEIVLDRSSA